MTARARLAIAIGLLLPLAMCAGCRDRLPDGHFLSADGWGCSLYAKRDDMPRPACVAWVDLEWVAQEQDRAKRRGPSQQP
jgi:hypothetical protein